MRAYVLKLSSCLRFCNLSPIHLSPSDPVCHHSLLYCWHWSRGLMTSSTRLYLHLLGNVECYLLQYSVHTCRLCTNWLEMRKYVQITITLQYWANRYYGHHTIDHPILVGPPPKTARGIVSWFHDWNIVLYQLCGDLRYYLLCWSRLIWTWRVWIPTDHATGLMQP